MTTQTIKAIASPEKRLFISLITRDITLVDAFLDLIDNSINAIIEPLSGSLTSWDDFKHLLDDENIEPKAKIKIDVSSTEILISDNAEGIDTATATDEIFRFGKSSQVACSRDRLSVYGIGLKRAIFKMADRVEMSSDHVQGGFTLDLNVPEWEASTETPWSFNITARAPVTSLETGTSVRLTSLHQDVVRRIEDGVFLDDLKKRIARTYAFYISKLVVIEVNKDRVQPVALRLGENSASSDFKVGGVTCNIIAGIAAANGSSTYVNENAGWYVFCNGRTVIFADKTELTGWGGGVGLPIFQPKHRPFMGLVFFFSTNPEALPWTTTKAAINEESAVWQDAKRQMIVVGKQITRYLDKRYGSEGTEVSPSELREAAGAPRSALQASTNSSKAFVEPVKAAPVETKVQYFAKKEDVTRIAKYLRRPAMSAAEVGRSTFDFFLKNEVGNDE